VNAYELAWEQLSDAYDAAETPEQVEECNRVAHELNLER
jgi:hypothetical protein